MKNASEGGAWGIAVLALYRATKSSTLEDFLDKLFANAEKETVIASDEEKKKFASFMQYYKKGLEAERKAVECLN
jgi:sugar (pentulose or hexulose) kinase